MPPIPPRQQIAALKQTVEALTAQVSDLTTRLAAKDAEFSRVVKEYREASDGMGERIVNLTAIVADLTAKLASAKVMTEAEVERRAGVEESYTKNLMHQQVQINRLEQELFEARERELNQP